MPAAITPGRLLLTVIILGLPPGAFIADYSDTHLFNPRWPPHARFHNAQTMSMSICLTLATLYYTWRTPPGLTTPTGSGPRKYTTKPDNSHDNGDSICIATVFACIYPLTSLSAWFFPGVLAVDPEFGEGFPQLPLFVSGLALIGLACWLELSRVARINNDAVGVAGKARLS